LALDGSTEVRVRYDDGSACLTIKGGTGLVRTEVEVDLAHADAESLWPLTEGRRLEKRRWRVPIDGGLVAELDEYEGALAGLRTVEVELPDLVAAEAFAPPSWFGREVTGDPRWSNASLARWGPPEQ
jgi:CYTH domain-containing protein